MSNSPLSLADIKQSFSGAIITPQDSNYDTFRTPFYGGIDRKPAVILMSKNAADVQTAVRLARESNLELAVRSGGHSPAGYCTCEGGILLDLREMTGVEVNDKEMTVWAESGLTAGQLTQELDMYNLAIGFGDTGSVGIGGITLSGGIGYLVRKYGMTIDNLLAAEIVTANGDLLITNEQSHPDLFWAIRGGGGNFGVITRFKYRLHQVSHAVGGMMILPAAPDTIVRFMELANQAPNELSTILNAMPCPPMPFVPAEHHGKPVLMALMMFAGDVDTGEKVIAPFRSLETALADTVKPMRYAEIFTPMDSSYHPTAVSHNMFMSSVDESLANKIVEHVATSVGMMRVVQLRMLGGAMAEVPVEATAFAHRQSPIMVNVAALYQKPEDVATCEAWVKEVSDILFQGDDGSYVGFMDAKASTRSAAAYPGETGKRLARIKMQYDPGNLFHLNQNVLPE